MEMLEINSLQYYEMNQSLLSMLNTKKEDSLLTQLISNNQAKFEKQMGGYNANGLSTNKYKQVASATTSLIDCMTKISDGELYNMEDNEENRSKIIKTVGSFVAVYNSEKSALEKCGGGLYSRFGEEIEKALTESEDALKSIGISQEESGKLVVDYDVLSSSSIDTIKKVFTDPKTLGQMQESAYGIASIMNGIEKYNYSIYNQQGLY